MPYYLRREQLIPAPIERVWPFFCDPRNLDRLTPDELRFKIVTPEPPRMYPGQIIEYRVRFMPGLWSTWVTEIRHVREERYFVDEQRIGPYRLWYHEHHFEPVEGGVLMRDQVTYALPAGPLGQAVHALWVKAKLARIFDYRRELVRQIFPSNGAARSVGPGPAVQAREDGVTA